MQSLKLVITFCATIFITTGVLAHSDDAKISDAPLDSVVDESSKVSAAQAASLFNFISLPEEKKDTAKSSFDNNSSNKRVNVMEFFQTIF